MARISKISNPDFAKAVAEAYIDGCSRVEMAEMFGCGKDTITSWTQDIRVQTHAAKMAQERVTRITRRIDRTIEGRLQEASEMDTEVLLKIRKEFLDRALKIDLGAGKDNPDTVREAVDLMEAQPEFAAQLSALLAGQGVNVDRQADEGESED